MTKFDFGKADVILLFIFVQVCGFMVADFWLITHGFEQWSQSIITLEGAIFGGEVLIMAAYRALKTKYKGKYGTLEGEEDASETNE